MSYYRETTVRIVALVALLVTLICAEAMEQIAIPLIGFVILVLRGLISASRFTPAASSLYGFLTPTIAWAGNNILIALGLTIFALSPTSSATKRENDAKDQLSWPWTTPILCFIGGTILAEFVIAFDLLNAGEASILKSLALDSPNRVIDLLRALFDVHITSWHLGVRLLLLTLLVGLFSRDTKARRAFMRGLFIGAIISALYTIGQWVLVGSDVGSLPNQTSIWNALNRVSGLMSDPNAVGIVMALMIWIWSGFRAELGAGMFSLALFFAAGVISGSRTFVLSMIALAIWRAWTKFGYRAIGVGVGVGALAITGVSYLDYNTTLIGDMTADSSPVPAGIRRIITALSVARLDQTIFSRGVFLEFASAIGEGRWMWGIGADRFSEYVALVGAERNLVRGWVDNSNNFYLGLLVELGVVGAGCFLLSCCARRIVVGELRGYALAFFVMLALILVTGPHTDFSEVLVIVAVLVAALSSARSLESGKVALLATSAALAGVFASLGHEYGTYGWLDSRLGATRWLGNRARLRLECKAVEPGNEASEKTARAMLRAVYVPQSAPLEVRVYRTGSLHQRLEFIQPEHKEVVARCEPNESVIYLTITTHPSWSPYRAWPNRSPDRRLFGLEQPTRTQTGTW